MDILVTVNRTYLYPLSVMLKSLVCQHPGTPMRVFILHRSLTTEDFTALERSVDESTLTLVPVAADPHLLPQAPTTDRYPMEMYDRIFAAFQLPQDLEQVLYLDPDLVVNHPLDSLWELPLEEYFFAAASHVAKGMEKFNAIRLQSETPGPYINSGVLLMNLPVLRREQQIQPVLDYVQAHRKTARWIWSGYWKTAPLFTTAAGTSPGSPTTWASWTACGSNMPTWSGSSHQKKRNNKYGPQV